MNDGKPAPQDEALIKIIQELGRKRSVICGWGGKDFMGYSSREETEMRVLQGERHPGRELGKRGVTAEGGVRRVGWIGNIP